MKQGPSSVKKRGGGGYRGNFGEKRTLMQAPTKRPPFEPPLITNFSLLVYLFSIKYSAAAMKSSNTFCFFSLVPALCHSSPYSDPPLMFATTLLKPKFSKI